MRLRPSLFSALLFSSLVLSGCSTVQAPTNTPAASPAAVSQDPASLLEQRTRKRCHPQVRQGNNR